MICIDERIIKKHLESVIKRTHNKKHIQILKKIIMSIDAIKDMKNCMYM